MRALIDGDIVLYACGFAVESKLHKVYVEADMEQGHIAEFKYKKELKAFLELGEDSLCYETEEIVEPLSHAVHLAKQLIEKIIEATSATEYTVYLTGDSNFRDELVDYYKKNRDPNHKPVHYKALKAYLIEKHGAVIVEGQEADDAMGIEQHQRGVLNEAESFGCTHWPNCDVMECDHSIEQSVICTTDKDLDMIPGWHYNWTKDSKYWIDEAQAIRWFYTQLLMGDPTDNIKGIEGIGKVKALQILEGLETVDDYYTAVYNAYSVNYDMISEVLQENADLLWIRREENVGWRPPECLN